MTVITQTTGAAAEAAPSPFLPRPLLIAAALVMIAALALFGGARYGLLLAVGLGFGIALEGLRFGFAGPWRAMILRREPAGILAQLLAIALVSVVAFPLLAAHPGEMSGAEAPIGFAMLGGAFVFGAAMQVVLGCGSGTLVNAGSGNPVSLLALPFFAIGSFFGAYGMVWWTNLGALPILVLKGTSGLVVTLIALALVAGVLLLLGKPGTRRMPRRLLIAALAIAALAVANLVVSGQPWGVVYGLGLWTAKVGVALGADLSGSAFWSAPGTVARLNDSILTDITSLTNIGIIAGAFGVAAWRRGGLEQGIPKLPARAWGATIVAGLLLGYSSRIAFGCNVGAFFSGISTGSLHGWAWFVMAFLGAFVGIWLRPRLGLEARR
ncbi:YeeE/YedE family protein [Pseudooceanicola sediminis]|uniref:YeeE/YedE family protein n=1 Tax=Pseudooceanicola sediminis TaxID=2211117 RepID=A0A399J0C3_9RHOB|nr:YeeE/YedE family protein [Puniceibacterium sp. HSS470]RII38873.1 YeeE/YedE family protein [Pseudooceanicola sediminis]|tara:strand:- start:69875 stop:71017 length:1143 start_codon:yes stop_codon:yes gene_type:complete